MSKPKSDGVDRDDVSSEAAVVVPPAGFDPWVRTWAEAAEQPNGINESIDAWKAWGAAQRLLEQRDVIEGSGVISLAGIALALKNGVMPPPWLVVSFLQRWAKFETLEARSLDEAFDHTPPTQRLAGTAKRHAELMPKVHGLLVAAIDKDPEKPIHADLFEEVAEQLNISRRLCEQLYWKAVNLCSMGRLTDLKAGLKAANRSEVRKSVRLPRKG